MDEALKLKAEQLAGDIAAQAQTLDDRNGLIRTLMKSALQRMLDTEPPLQRLPMQKMKRRGPSISWGLSFSVEWSVDEETPPRNVAKPRRL